MNRIHRLLLAGLASLLLLAACGTSGSDEGTDTEPTTTAAGGGEDGGDTEGGGGGAAVSMDDIQSAVVQIVAKGTFAEPAGTLAAYEEIEGAGSGSGFIIDESGIAVTNNHVVTGAATLEVFVGGSDESVSAKVLGVSECSDLAVIDLEGDGYPFVAWSEAELKTGLEVRAAGFPLGDPEFTLTSGIVSKAEASGDTNWASVESVIEHDANIQPGNSGGPLVDAETGEVVAVNYAGFDPGTGTAQFFAIASDLAKPLAEQLQGGDVGSLGVNGQAVYDEESGVFGIWVASVDTNSPAGALGLQGGDIIERIEGLSVGADGTLKDYCDILDSHEPTDKLSVQVLRYAENTRLEGEFNGKELEPVALLSEEVVEDTGGDLATGEEYAEYTTVTDDSGNLSVNVPSTWTDVDGRPITLDDGTEYANVQASPDIESFLNSWTTPGIDFTAAPGDAFDGDVAGLLDAAASDAVAACTDAGRDDYDDGFYTGLIQVFQDCGGAGGGALVMIVAQPSDASFVARVMVQLATEADLAVLDEVIATFSVIS